MDVWFFRVVKWLQYMQGISGQNETRKKAREAQF
jgi:hypothetical protein